MITRIRAMELAALWAEQRDDDGYPARSSWHFYDDDIYNIQHNQIVKVTVEVIEGDKENSGDRRRTGYISAPVNESYGGVRKIN